MSLHVIESDAPCHHCGDEHGYVTSKCALAVFVDRLSALWVSKHIEGSTVREIDEVPLGISYTVFAHKGGKPDPNLPRREHALSRG